MPIFYGNQRIPHVVVTATGAKSKQQSKTVIPSKIVQNIKPDTGYTGLSSVRVEAIPQNFQDVSGVTAKSSDILVGKKAIDSSGEIQGSIPVISATDKILDTKNISYSIPLGYHDGKGKIRVDLVDEQVQSGRTTQTITAKVGKLIKTITVNPIPSYLQDVRETTVTENQMLSGAKAVGESGVITGKIATISNVNTVLDESNTSYAVPVGYHDGSSKVSVTLRSKQISPASQIQKVHPDKGTLLNEVVVEAIPSNYKDVSQTTVTASQMLTGAKAVGKDGIISGNIPTINLGTKYLDTTVTQYTIPKGYHTGAEIIKINTETKTVDPSSNKQTVSPTGGKVLQSVVVNPIPANYVDTSDSNATSQDILSGKSAFVQGKKVSGNLVVQNYYTGSTVPSNALGSDGDIYLKV